MIYSDALQKIRNFNIIVNPKFKTESVSNNILKSNIGGAFFDTDISTLFSEKMMFDDVKNTIDDLKLIEYDILGMVKQVFLGKEIHDKKIVISLRRGSLVINYSFFFTATLLKGVVDGVDILTVSILIRDYNKFNSNEERYLNYFQQFETEFDLVKKMNIIGRFVIDFELNKYKVYGNEAFPGLLGLKKSVDNFYKLNSRTENTILEDSIIKSKPFYNRLDLLLTEKIELLTDEWKVSDKWLRLEAKILTKNLKGTPKMIGGIIYDVTDFHNYKDLENVHLFYELAIQSGGIGMFHYDLDIHDPNVFTANEIYANLFGLNPDENGMYKTEDFLKAQLCLEENISKYDEVNTQLKKIVSGEVTGTNDDILKIKDLKTGYIRYLLSSSKIDTYYEDGRAKRFGGIVIDITDRIIRERNQTKFLYKDELTSLGNNRLLAKNMLVAEDGLGLFFDLDNFKRINDTYGHLMGDKMIKFFGECINKVAKIYENIEVYRLYGDEFFVFCEKRDKSFAVIYERKVKEEILIKMKTINEEIVLVASMGTAMFKKGSSIDDFIKNADYSMYEIKIGKKKREN